jgi:hypothetical protein
MAEAGTTSPFNRCFIRQGRRDKRLLRKILEPPQIAELTPDEKLDQMLLWLDDLEIIESARSEIFSGGPFPLRSKRGLGSVKRVQM